MKIDLTKYTKKASGLLKKLSKVGGFSATIIFLIFYIYLVLQIMLFIQKAPTDEAINEKLQRITLPRIDQSSINRINSLKDQNVKVKSLFDKARQNPFNE